MAPSTLTSGSNAGVGVNRSKENEIYFNLYPYIINPKKINFEERKLTSKRILIVVGRLVKNVIGR